MSHCERITKNKQQQRSCILVHNTHTTREESAESGRRDFTGAIFYFHSHKRSYVDINRQIGCTGAIACHYFGETEEVKYKSAEFWGKNFEGFLPPEFTIKRTKNL